VKVWCEFPRAWRAYGLALRLEVPLEAGATVGHLLQALQSRADSRLRSLLMDSDGRRKTLVFVAGAPVDDSRRLEDGDTVLFVAPIAGGGSPDAAARCGALPEAE
jgi:molybdopterin converting factor small subunit